MRWIVLLLVLLLFSCGDKITSSGGVADSSKIKSSQPAREIYIELDSAKVITMALSSTAPLNLSIFDVLIEPTVPDSLKHLYPTTGINVTLPLLSELYEDTVQIPVSVVAPTVEGDSLYSLTFSIVSGDGVSHQKVLRLHIGPEPPTIELKDLLPERDTLLPLEVDTVTFTVEANKVIDASNISFRFLPPSGISDLSSTFTASIVPAIPDTTLLCTAVVSLLSPVGDQGYYKMRITGNNNGTKDSIDARFYVEAGDSLTLDSLILEAPSVSPGGQLEGEFQFDANKYMYKQFVAFEFKDQQGQLATTIKGSAHSFDSTFRGTVEYDLNVGAATPFGVYTYTIIMTNDSLSDSLTGTFEVAPNVVEQLRIMAYNPATQVLHPGFGQAKTVFSISSSKRIDTRNSSFQLLDTGVVDVKGSLEFSTEDFKEVNGLYEATLSLRAGNTFEVGDYFLKYRCELDSVGDSVTIPLTVTPISITVGDIPDQVIAKGASVTLTTTITSSAEFDPSEFQSEVVSAPGSAPLVEFLSFVNGVLTFSVTVPTDALVSEASVKVGIAQFKEYFKVTIVEP